MVSTAAKPTVNNIPISVTGPRISVITVVYNAEKLLEQTILSVLEQNYDNIEYIIIDGGSKDDTLSIIKKYEEDIAYWKSEPDKGIYDAMNKAIEAATGDWVYFLGAGDTLLSVFEDIGPALKDKNCVYYGDVYRFDLQRIYDGEFSKFKLAVSNICQQAIFYPLSALKKYKFNLKYKAMADHELNMKISGDSNYSFKYLPIIIANYDGDGYSETNLDFPFYEDKLDIIKANFPLHIYLYAFTRTQIAKRFKKGYLQKKPV